MNRLSNLKNCKIYHSSVKDNLKWTAIIIHTMVCAWIFWFLGVVHLQAPAY